MDGTMKLTDLELVQALTRIESGLTCKELDFVESIASWVEDSARALTEKQRAWGEAILERLGR